MEPRRDWYWLLVTSWNMTGWCFPETVGNLYNHPNWRTFFFQRGRVRNHQDKIFLLNCYVRKYNINPMTPGVDDGVFLKWGDYPNSWMVLESYWNAWFRGTPVSGKPPYDTINWILGYRMTITIYQLAGCTQMKQSKKLKMWLKQRQKPPISIW